MEHDEKEEDRKINPFERRACRPSTAWDTSLTYVEEGNDVEKRKIRRDFSHLQNT